MWQTDGFAASQQGQSERAVECWGPLEQRFPFAQATQLA